MYNVQRVNGHIEMDAWWVRSDDMDVMNWIRTGLKYFKSSGFLAHMISR
jgi:hypothetical protein